MCDLLCLRDPLPRSLSCLFSSHPQTYIAQLIDNFGWVSNHHLSEITVAWVRTSWGLFIIKIVCLFPHPSTFFLFLWFHHTHAPTHACMHAQSSAPLSTVWRRRWKVARRNPRNPRLKNEDNRQYQIVWNEFYAVSTIASEGMSGSNCGGVGGCAHRSRGSAPLSPAISSLCLFCFCYLFGLRACACICICPCR